MSKRTIPILIGAMILALVGIIIIQYQWFEQSYQEKKKLIDLKVHQMVDNIDQRVTDFNALAFISDVPMLDSTLIFQALKPFEFANYDTTHFGDSMVVSYHHEFKDSSSRKEVEVRVVTGDDFQFNPFNKDEYCDDSIEIQFHQHHHTEDIVDFDNITSMMDRIKLEVSGNIGDNRLDSALIREELIAQSSALGLLAPLDWGVYDDLEHSYAIQPKKEQEWDYELPLFKEDLIYPNRYVIRLDTEDMTASIWRQISLMILLSLIFIAIIVLVFIYSIRLVIKHKKISAIKSDFINNMTHEFKTPLASISLAADSILHPKVAMDPGKVQSYIDIIKVEKNKLNRHIETILEVASLKENDVPLELSKIDLNHCVNDAIEKLSLLVEDRNCTIKQDLAEETFVMANYYQLENVFSNLIENSIKYSPEKPEVSISSKKIGNRIQVAIEDRGIGMTREQIRKAFDHFYRAQKGNIHNTKGFGLGLSFVKYMMDKMDGSIHIESKLNEGTTVFLEFELRN